MKVVIYNDTFLETRPHFGCELVMNTFREQLNRVDIELLGTVKLIDKNPKNKLLEKADLVIVNGEGSFHHNRRNDLAEVSKYFPSILINTVFYENNVDTTSFLFKSARESKSADNLNCSIIPDIIFTSKILEKLTSQGHMVEGQIKHNSQIKTLQRLETFLPELMKYKEVSSQSFHGIIVCALLGIKCTKVYDGSGVPYKTHCLYEDMKNNLNYIEDAKNSINSMFENLHNLL